MQLVARHCCSTCKRRTHFAAAGPVTTGLATGTGTEAPPIPSACGEQEAARGSELASARHVHQRVRRGTSGGSASGRCLTSSSSWLSGRFLDPAGLFPTTTTSGVTSSSSSSSTLARNLSTYQVKGLVCVRIGNMLPPLRRESLFVIRLERFDKLGVARL